MEPDVWGAIYRDQFAGLIARHELERDGGRVEVYESEANGVHDRHCDGLVLTPPDPVPA